MSLGNKIRHGAMWLFVGRTGQQALTFAVGIVMARLLVPEDFGLLLTIQVFTGFAGFLAGGGMGQALVRAKEATKRDYDIVFTLQLAIGCLIYSAFFISAPWFAQWYGTPLYTDLLRVSALSFIFRPMVNLPGAMLHRQMRFKADSIIAIAALVVSSSTSILLAWSGYGVWSLIWGGIAASVFKSLVLILVSGWRPGLSMNIRGGKDIARYGFLTFANDFVCYLIDQTSIFILSNYLGPASVGLYNKGESMAKMPQSFIAGSVYQVLFRSMAAEQGNLDRCRYLFFRSIALVAVYATPFYIGLLWLSEPLVRGLYGEKWIGAASSLLVLALAWPFWLIAMMSGAVLAAHNWLDRELPVQLTTFVICAITIVIAVPHGIEGVAIAIVLTAIYRASHLYWLATKRLQARPSRLVASLAPAAVLNILLALALAITSALMPEKLHSLDLAYIGLMTAIGAIVYSLSFLYLPFSSLHSEQSRWKSKLGLARWAP